MVMRGQVGVITGASAGVGRATAIALGRTGMRLALIARGEERLEAACGDVAAAGGEALPIVADVSDAEQVKAAGQRVERDLGPINVWVNSAMVTVFSPVADMAPEEFRRVTEVTYLGAVNGTMAALDHMLPRDRGTIVQVGSALAYRAIPLQSAYCGAKHAIRGFTDSLRAELLHRNSSIRLTMVHLPAHNTPQFEWSLAHTDRRPQPVPPIYSPEVAAEAVAWSACHPRRREVFVGSSTNSVVLANKVAPGFLDRYFAQAGYQGQMTDQPNEPGMPNNLFTPVSGDFGVRGPFTTRSRKRSWALWAVTHLPLPAAAELGSGLWGGVETLLNLVRKRS